MRKEVEESGSHVADLRQILLGAAGPIGGSGWRFFFRKGAGAE